MSRYFNKETEEYYLWTEETGEAEHTGTILDWRDPGSQATDEPVYIGCLTMIAVTLTAGLGLGVIFV